MPIFVQVLRPNEKMFLGVGLGSGVRTDYDMAHFRQPPPQCTHLTGKLFYSNLKSVASCVIKYTVCKERSNIFSVNNNICAFGNNTRNTPPRAFNVITVHSDICHLSTV